MLTRSTLSGTAYRDGGLLIPDTVKAQKLFERAAEQEIDAAQYALGKLYLSDDADVHDSAKGVYWLKRSADNGNDYAAYRLGKEYLGGENVSKERFGCGGISVAGREQRKCLRTISIGKAVPHGRGRSKRYGCCLRVVRGGAGKWSCLCQFLRRSHRSWGTASALGHAGSHAGCSITWVISFGTTLPLCQQSVASTLTVNGCRSFSVSALPSATSRTIMNSNNNRGIQCSSIDSADIPVTPHHTACGIAAARRHSAGGTAR